MEFFLASCKMSVGAPVHQSRDSSSMVDEDERQSKRARLMDEARRAGEERRAAQEQARVAQEQARAAEERENAALAELADMAGDNMYVKERNRLGGNVSTDLWRKLCMVPSSTCMRARSNDWYSQELPVGGSQEHAQVLFIDPSDDGQTHWLQQVEKIPQQEGAATTVPPKLSVLEALPVLPSMVEEMEEEASLRICLQPHPRRELAAVKGPPMGLGRRWQWELQQLVRGDPQKGLPLLFVGPARDPGLGPLSDNSGHTIG